MYNQKIVESFWATMATNDFYAAAQFLHDEYGLEWPQSGERIRGRNNFAVINSAYLAAGKWTFKINRIVAGGDEVVTDVDVSDGRREDRVITFSTIRDGKIWKQVEFWPENFEPPAWREQWVEKF